MEIWSKCDICGRDIPVGELCYGLKKGNCICKNCCTGFENCTFTLAPMPTLTPPNDPLTLEQLRKMDGEPVWIVDVGPHKWYGPGWAIVDRDNCLVRSAKNWNPVFFERYGERWIAYRRPPEGEEDT